MQARLVHQAAEKLRRWTGWRPALVRQQTLGRHFVVRDGSLSNRSDYDGAWLLASALHAETVFDIGANVGQSSLLVLLSQTVRQVVLVEANPEALVVAAENLIRSDLVDRARFVCSFAGETDHSEVRLWTIGTGAAGSADPGLALSAVKAASSFIVPTVTLDSLCDKYGIVPDLVKIDVEGAEHRVLRGSKLCASHLKTRFLVEMHRSPNLSMRANAAQVLAWCQDHGYAAWYLAKELLLDAPEPIQHRGRCHVLLQPAAWPYPQWLKGIRQSAALERA